MKILLVEDDQPTGELLTVALRTNRYVVDLADDGEIALELVASWDYDLILLDVRLPKLDGIQVCRRIRAQGKRMPILMLTAQGANQDVITGLDAGADDYVVKPCDLDQLLARIRSLLRRGAEISPEVLAWADLRLEPQAGRVTYQQQEMPLRHKEYMLLELFLRHPQRIFSRSAILDHLWTVDSFPSEGAVTNLIKDLRQRLTAVGMPSDFIETLYGLGYRLKALPQDEIPASAENASPAALPEAVPVEQLEQFKERFQNSLAERSFLLKEAEQAILAGSLSEDLRQRVKQQAHQLVSSLGLYGYSKASQIARSIDRLFALDIASIQQQIGQLSQWLAELQRELSQPAQPVASLLTASAPLVLVLSEDDQWAEVLQQEAGSWNLRVEVIPEWSLMRQFVRETPTAIVIESREAVFSEAELETLGEIKQQMPQVPVLMLATQDDLTNRLVAARSGSERYFIKPILPTQLLEAIVQLLSRQQAAPESNLLLVDDHADVLHVMLTHLLQPWGIRVTSLREPDQFWQVLTQGQPDLVLLNIDAPALNGIDLCRVVRQDTRYSDLPIIAMTAQTESAAIQQVFDAGADDLVQKPLVDSELVARIVNRIERARLRRQIDHLRHQQIQLLHQQATIDELTRLTNRRTFNRFLHQVWQPLQQKQQPLSLILCDVDQFRLYNDRYGYAAGDLCLQRIAGAIQQCLKPETDQVSRYGGEEFAIALPHTPPSDAVSVTERIQAAIARLKIPHSDTAASPYVTLSLGMTGTVPTAEKSIDQLVAMADRALYAAKQKGRNTYCLYLL